MRVWDASLLLMGCSRVLSVGGSPESLELSIIIENEPGAAKPSLNEEKELFNLIKNRVISQIQNNHMPLREPSEDEQVNGPKSKKIILPQKIEVGSKNGVVSPANSPGAGLRSRNAANTMVSKKPTGLFLLKDRKSFLAGKEDPKAASDGRPKEVLEFTDDILKIGTDKNLFLTIINNLDSIETMGYRSSIGEIGGISAYKDASGNIMDFWNRLTFENKDGEMKDKTLYFRGVLRSSWEDLVKSSKMGKSGFFIGKDVSDSEEWLMVYRLKRLITEVAYFRKMSVSELMAKNKPFGMANDIIFFNYYPLKLGDVIDICVCQNNDCKAPCTEIRRIHRKSLL